MRLKLPELLESRDMSPYRFAKAMSATGRVSESTAYRMVQERGELSSFDAEALEALCEVFKCEPGRLFERRRPAKRS